MDLSKYTIEDKGVFSSSFGKPPPKTKSKKSVGRPVRGESKLDHNVRVNFTAKEYMDLVKESEKTNTPLATLLRNKIIN